MRIVLNGSLLFLTELWWLTAQNVTLSGVPPVTYE
jgi:hypothetical protein